MARVNKTMKAALPPRGRRESNKLDKRKRIIAAARALFHEKGFELATTQEVAKRAGVGAGTLFLYVQTKEDLLILAFVDEMAEVTQRSFGEIDTAAPVADRIVDFLTGIFGYHSDDVRLTKHLLREVGVLRNLALIEEVHGLPVFSLLRAIVEDAQGQAELGGDVDAQDIANLLFALYWDCLREWVNGVVDADAFGQRLHKMVVLAMRGIGAGAVAHRGRPPRVGRWTKRAGSLRSVRGSI